MRPLLQVPFSFTTEHAMDEIQRRFRFKQDVGQRLTLTPQTPPRYSFSMDVSHPLLGFTILHIVGTLTPRGKTQTMVDGTATPLVANFISWVVLPLVVIGLLMGGIVSNQFNLIALGMVMGLVSALGYLQRRNHVALGVEHYFNRIFYL